MEDDLSQARRQAVLGQASWRAGLLLDDYIPYQILYVEYGFNQIVSEVWLHLKLYDRLT